MYEWINEHKAQAVGLAIIVALIIAYVAGWRSGSGADVHDNENGISTAGEQLNQAKDNQSGITAGIDHAEDTAGAVADSISEGEAGIADAQDTAGQLEAGRSEAGAIIDDCQSILAGVRARGEAQADGD
jgi:peptidoglycan hydrolase CwlO-like protein